MNVCSVSRKVIRDVIGCLVLLGLLLGGPLGLGTSLLGEEKPAEPITVPKVVSAKLAVAKGSLTVTAVGEVPTAGFTKPTLTRVTYVKQPDDGIQDYTFEAVPPDGVAAQVISEVKASDTWESVPDWVKGVRIHGVGEGVLVKMLEK
jgi:hypothetical protein